MKSSKVAILDAGSQLAKLIDRRVRELGFETQIIPIESSLEQVRDFGALIISGSSQSVNNEGAPMIDPRILLSEIPILGICYGMQLINKLAGGEVVAGAIREDGQDDITIDENSPLFAGLTSPQKVLLTHGDSVTSESLAPGYESIGVTSNDILAAIVDTKRKVYGVQFHPEVDLTQNGTIMFDNFLTHIALLDKNFTIEDREAVAIKLIREKVGNRKVLSLVSGGVDSTVCTALLAKALPKEQIIALHIDNGFMRHEESKKVKEALGALGVDLHVIDASQDFYNATAVIDLVPTKRLSEVTDPEEKRRIIGDMFITRMQQELEKLGLDPNEVMLAMGTLRPDLIESASPLVSSKATKIKTHHNDTQLVRDLRKKGLVIEPLTEYHKDEVRALGESLGLPKELVWRQPFPGPGLAIRIICAQEPYMTDAFEDIKERLKQFDTPTLKTTLIPIQTVGMQGDGRSYSYLVSISGEASWEERIKLANRIPQVIHQVNRVVHVIKGKSNAMYYINAGLESDIDSITPTHLTPDVIEQVRAVDEIVNQYLHRYDLTRILSQVPVISFPVGFGELGKRSIAIRAFISPDFMTGRPAIPGKDFEESILQEMVDHILREVPGIARVVYDLTSKPPGTTEWE